MTAMDRTKSDIELLLLNLKPDIVVFDFAYWLPKLARSLVSLSIKLHNHEAREFAALKAMKFGSNVIFYDRLCASLSQCDATGFRTCREIEGSYIDNLGSHFRKPVFLSGPIIPNPPTSTLEEKWIKWLGKFKARSVIYCAFGSECTLKRYQFQELVLGFELSGWPFLAALKPPLGAGSIEEALPEGFEERVQGRGVVHGGWVQQLRILEHPSIGCFITHCGLSSLFEGLMNQFQLVGVEIEKGEEDGLFTKESVCKAVRTVMEDDNEVGREVKANHTKLRDLLSSEYLESSYIDSFCQNLQDLVG
nr:udp-glycosyltransferase 79b30 [Quercus suber]